MTSSINFSKNYQIYIEKDGKDITKNYLIKHYEDNHGLNNYNVVKKDNLKTSKSERVLIRFKIKKGLLSLQLIFGAISLITVIFILYNIIFKRNQKKLAI